jgi:RNA polymerase sigma factor (sigma-70 family)
MTALTRRENVAKALEALEDDRTSEDAWRVLITALRPKVLAISMRCLQGDRDLAEDSCQEVLIRLAAALVESKRPELFDADRLDRYVVRMAVNSSIDYLRAYARRHAKNVNIENAVTPVSAPEPEKPDERLELLRTAVKNLNPKDRRVIELSLQGLTVREISNELGFTYGATAVRLHRIRYELAKSLRHNEIAAVDDESRGTERAQRVISPHQSLV